MNAIRKVVVITPVRNEDWILREFLIAASLIADHILLIDHLSTDQTPAIAAEFPKVKILKTRYENFAERERRNELLIAAREYGQGNVILSLDADEFLTSDFFRGDSLGLLQNAKVGSRFHAPLMNVSPDLQNFWSPGNTPFGFVDDGSIHEHSNLIHFPRIPQGDSSQNVHFTNSGLLHMQFIRWDRMESKHRWYKVWEVINFPEKSRLDIMRRYSHMYVVPNSALRHLESTWAKEFSDVGIDFQRIAKTRTSNWWDAEVVKLISEHGPSRFRNLGMDSFMNEFGFNLPRSTSKVDRALEIYLAVTEPLYKRGDVLAFRILLRFLDLAFNVVTHNQQPRKLNAGL